MRFGVTGAALLLSLSACGGGGESVTVSAPVQAAAKNAFQYGYPLTETMRVCDLITSVNRLQFSATLSTPQNRAVVAPNNDTLYGSACVYLGDSWVMVTLPPAQGRYMSLHVLDAYTNTVAIRGPRQVPSQGGQYVLRYRPGSGSGGGNATAITAIGQSPAPAGVPIIDVPTPYAYVITRTLVNDPSDVAAADAAQRGITMQADSNVTPPRAALPVTNNAAHSFFLRLSQRLAQNPPPASEVSLVQSFAPAGVTANIAPSLSQFSAEQLLAWESAYREGLVSLDTGSDLSAENLGSLRNGWRFPGPNLGNFGGDFVYRAYIARKGLFSLTRDEATYLTATADGNGAALDGNRTYTLRLPAAPEWPPVETRGFWSLTMYGSDGFLVANVLDRYAIGGRTPGLVFEPDGSVVIRLQCTEPPAAARSNWLPAPCGRFQLMMRLYLPLDSVWTPEYSPPAITPG